MRVCLVSHSADPLLGLPSGGSEGQTALLARHMAARGHEVTLVVPGLGRRPGTRDGVDILSGWDPARGLRFLRAPTYRYPELRRVLIDLKADVYYTRTVAFFTPTVVAAAHARGTPALLAIASDGDLHPSAGRYQFGIGPAPLQRIAGRAGYSYFRRYALTKADRIIVQNATQSAACAALGLRACLIPNIVETPPADLLDAAAESDCVWIGNVVNALRRSKGLGELVRLTEAGGDLRFTVIGDLSSAHVGDLVARLESAANVDFLGPLGHDEALERIAHSRVVLNTSPSEGFSNVMLEGWSLGKPVLTLRVDPDRLLTRGGLGVCAGGDPAALLAALRDLAADPGRLRHIGNAARDYVRSNHAPHAVCERFEAVVGELA